MFQCESCNQSGFMNCYMNLTLNQTSQKGIESQKVGQIQEVERLYPAILKASPKHPGANNNQVINE